MPMRDGPASAARLCDRRELSVEVAKTVFEMRAVDRRAQGTERGQGFTLGAELPIEGSAAGMIRTAGEPHFIKPEEVGDTIFALCSGLLDAMSGQVITVDNGGSFSDNLMRLYRSREEYGL